MVDLKSELKQPEPELTHEAQKAVRVYISRLAIMFLLLSSVVGYLVKEIVEKNVIVEIEKKTQPTLDTLHEQIGSTRKEVEQYKEAIAAAKEAVENSRKLALSAQLEVEKYKDAIAAAKLDIEESRSVANNAKISASASKDEVVIASSSTKKTLAEVETFKIEIQSLRDVYKNLKEFKEIQEAVVKTLSGDLQLKKSIADTASIDLKEALKLSNESMNAQIQVGLVGLEGKFYSKAAYPTLGMFGKLQAFTEHGEHDEKIYSLRGISFFVNSLRVEGDLTHVKSENGTYTQDAEYWKIKR